MVYREIRTLRSLGGFDFAIAQYLPDGTLDTSFATGGILTLDVSGSGEDDEAHSMFLQPAGFGAGGKVVTSFTSTGEELAFAIAPQQDGKFVVGGAVGNGGFARDFALARYEGVENSADVKITMTDMPDPVSTGQPLQYAINVQHLSGSQCAFDVSITHTIPSTMSLVSATASQGICHGTTTVSCQLGPLMLGQTATVVITATPTATGTYRNEASVTSTTPDPNPANNQVRVSTTVQ